MVCEARSGRSSVAGDSRNRGQHRRDVPVRGRADPAGVVPRDRAGTFRSRLLPVGQRRLGGLDDMIISLYAGRCDDPGRPRHHHVAGTIGTELSHETIPAASPTRPPLEEVLA